MSLIWSIDATHNPALIRMQGKFRLGPQLLQFSRQAFQLLSAVPPRSLVINMHEVAEIDSSGVGELVTLYTSAGQASCSLCLVSASAPVMRMLAITKLSGMLPQFASEEEAVAWSSSESRP